ncbi:unnamed protein product, partial [Allacma fusca]
KGSRTALVEELVKPTMAPIRMAEKSLGYTSGTDPRRLEYIVSSILVRNRKGCNGVAHIMHDLKDPGDVAGRGRVNFVSKDEWSGIRESLSMESRADSNARFVYQEHGRVVDVQFGRRIVC